MLAKAEIVFKQLDNEEREKVFLFRFRNVLTKLRRGERERIREDINPKTERERENCSWKLK